MSKNYIFLIYILFFILYSSNWASAIEEDKCNNEYFSNIEPYFSIIVRERTPVIDPGKPLQFKLYFSGYGAINPKFTKISAYIPIVLVDSNEPIFGNIIYLSENNTDRQITQVNKPLYYSPDYTEFHIPIPAFYFEYILNENLCQIKAERLINGHAPLTININTSKNVSFGDQKIDFILSYTDGNKSYQNIQEAKFHINFWWEQSYNFGGFSLQKKRLDYFHHYNFLWYRFDYRY